MAEREIRRASDSGHRCPRLVVRRPRGRSPRAVARLVPVPRLISVGRTVKVSFVTPGIIIARSILARRGSRHHARFLALRLRSGRAVGRDRHCIVQRLSRGRLVHRAGSLGKPGGHRPEAAVSRLSQACSAPDGPRTVVEPRFWTKFCASATRCHLLRQADRCPTPCHSRSHSLERSDGRGGSSSTKATSSH